MSTNIFGCYVSSTMGDNCGELFRNYIWGEGGIGNILAKINQNNYGNDLLIILFQFYINPIPFELNNLKEIENYRKKEKSIGIPIIINQKNFFDKSDEERNIFLKKQIFEKIDILEREVKKRKLDTKIDKLKSDLRELLN